MLTGENGILTKATTAKENTQRAEVIERAQIDIVSAQAENESGDITKAQLKTILDKYFTDKWRNNTKYTRRTGRTKRCR